MMAAQWLRPGGTPPDRPSGIPPSLQGAHGVFFAKENPVAPFLPSLPRYHGENMTLPWRALAMASMSRDAPPSAFTGPW
jgi:hypothetical protein